MALNAASHNPASEKTGPVSGKPPSASQETTAAILEASKDDSIGQIEASRDRGDNEAPKKIKSEKGLEKERKKAEARKKFEDKKAKTATASAVPSGSNTKEKKDKQDEEILPGFEWLFKDPFYKAYVPKAVESEWYAWWEKLGFFELEFGPD